MSEAAILLAAGRGNRMGGVVEDKALTPLQGVPALAYSIRAFAESGVVDTLVMTYRDDAQRAKLEAVVAALQVDLSVLWTLGGAERQDTVLNGLEALPLETEHVYIHDCARPLITAAMLQSLQATLHEEGAACLAAPVKDTIKRIKPEAISSQPFSLLEDMERTRLWAMQTPQAFCHAQILACYRQVRREGLRITDDAAAAALQSIPVALVDPQAPNPKLTTPDDLALMEFLLQQRQSMANSRETTA